MKKYLFAFIAFSFLAGASCQNQVDTKEEMKALSDKDIEVWNEKSGKPNVRLSGEVERVSQSNGVKDIIISMSHTRTYAVASVILVSGKA